MKRQHSKPCAQCPFRRAAIPGFLGGAHPDNFLQMADADVRMPCHLHLSEGVSYEAAQTPGTREHRAPQCAGRAIYWRNQAKLPRDPALLVLDADGESVFCWPQEFREHHREEALRFWQRLVSPSTGMEKEREVGMDQEASGRSS